MKNNFKIIVSAGGRFHIFYLANQLEKRGYLDRLITSYPKFETVKYGIPKDKIESILIKEILQRGWGTLPNFVKNIYNPTLLINNIFDKLAQKKINKPEIFVGLTSFSLHSLRKAKKQGAVTVIECGSSHVEYKDKILKEEYKKFSFEVKNIIHFGIIKKLLKEYKEADYIVVPSKYTKRTFIEKGIPEEKLIQVPYGVDLSDFRQVEKNDDIFRVVFAGGMTLQKGVHYLLQAFSELDLPNSELVLLGNVSEEIKSFFKKYNVEKSEEQEINKFLNKNGNRIRFLGHKKQNQLYKFYSQGSVYVQPSIQDGFGMVIIQAMACGLPVICTTNTGGPDIIEEGKNGYIIPIRNVEKLKEKLLYLYENPEKRDKMSKSAKERVSSGFTWDDYGNKIIKEYKNMLKK